jgi:hypothetical protein
LIHSFPFPPYKSQNNTPKYATFTSSKVFSPHKTTAVVYNSTTKYPASCLHCATHNLYRYFKTLGTGSKRKTAYLTAANIVVVQHWLPVFKVQQMVESLFKLNVRVYRLAVLCI